MKRSSTYPNRRSNGEFKLNSERAYNQIVIDNKKHASRVNPVFLEDHYGVKKVKA
jgi:hypothetical protein